MGDRGNIIIKDGESTVYLYTHWEGSRLNEILKSALKRGKTRWEDGAYLARIIFCEMIGEDTEELTGYGISSIMVDGGNDITVDIEKQTVNDKTFVEYIGGE